MFKKILILILALVIFISGCTTQEIVFNQKISPELQDRLRTTDLERIHAVVEFTRPISTGDLNNLDIKILGSLENNSVLLVSGFFSVNQI